MFDASAVKLPLDFRTRLLAASPIESRSVLVRLPRPANSTRSIPKELAWSCTRGSLHEGIEQCDAAAVEILGVPGRERQTVGERRRRNQHIRLRDSPTSRLARCAQLTRYAR